MILTWLIKLQKWIDCVLRKLDLLKNDQWVIQFMLSYLFNGNHYKTITGFLLWKMLALTIYKILKLTPIFETVVLDSQTVWELMLKFNTNNVHRIKPKNYYLLSLIKRCEVIAFIPVFIKSEIVQRSHNKTLLYIQSCLEKPKLKIYYYNIIVLYLVIILFYCW